MAVVSINELAQALYQAGFRGIQIPVMIAIAKAESGLNTETIGDRDIGGSYGLFQIYQPVWGDRFGIDCATDVQCSANAAFEISGGGTNYNPWSVFRFSKWGSDPIAGYANPFTRYVPEIFNAFGLDAALDIGKALTDPCGVLGKVPLIGETLESWCSSGPGLPSIPDVPGLPDVPGVDDFIPDDLESLLPSQDDIIKGVIAITLLGIGFTFIAIGAYGLVQRTGAAEKAVRVGTAVATRGASEIGTVTKATGAAS